jgi:hypothetical protein
VDPRPLLDRKAATLAAIDAKVKEARALDVKLSEQEANARALIDTMKKERQELVAQREGLEREVIVMQQGLAAAEAQTLAAQALRDQATRGETERLPLKAWQAKFREELIPVVTRIVSGLVKLRAILTGKGATLEQIAALRSQPGLDDGTRSEFIAVSVTAGKLLGDLHDRILSHERALAHAEDFVPNPGSPDGRSEINGLRRELENVSGIITGRLVDIVNPRADANPHPGIEGQTPASLDLAERVGSLLTQYAQVQKRANAVARPMPEIVIEIIPKESKPRHEVMAELRGPKPQQERAAGVPEEN